MSCPSNSAELKEFLLSMDHEEIDSSKLKSLPVPDLLSLDKKAVPKVSKTQ